MLSSCVQMLDETLGHMRKQVGGYKVLGVRWQTPALKGAEKTIQALVAGVIDIASPQRTV